MGHENLVTEEKTPMFWFSYTTCRKAALRNWILAKDGDHVIGLHRCPNVLKEKQSLVSAVRDEREIIALVQMAISVAVVFRASLKMILHCSLLNKNAGKKHGTRVIYCTQMYSNP